MSRDEAAESEKLTAKPAPAHSYIPQGHYHVTANGRLVDPWAMRADDDSILLDDIAHHLAQENRFGGACRYPHSVAAHSVNVAVRVAHYAIDADCDVDDCDEADIACDLLLGSVERGGFRLVTDLLSGTYCDVFDVRQACAAALLHDAHEYVGKDIPQPMKVRGQLAVMSLAEDEGMRVIRERFGVPSTLANAVRQWIKRADRYETRREIVHLLPMSAAWGNLADAEASPPVEELSWRVAKQRFLDVAALCGLA